MRPTSNGNGDTELSPRSRELHTDDTLSSLSQSKHERDRSAPPHGSKSNGDGVRLSRPLFGRHMSASRVTGSSSDNPQSKRPSVASITTTSDDESDVRGRVARAGPRSDHAVTVETETVPSVPALAVSTSGPGSLRFKKSNDNVTRGAYKASRKGLRLAAASKADMFAAKVASAVNEADSSNSDETFVYDTTPSIEQLRRQPYLRTSSTLSLPLSPHGPPGRPTSLATIHPAPERGGYSGSGHNTLTQSAGAGGAKNGGSRQPSATQTRDFLVAKDHKKSSQWSPHANNNKNSDSVRAKHDYLQRWRTPGSADDYDDEDEYVDMLAPHYSADERTPLRDQRSHIPRYTQRNLYNPHDYGVAAGPSKYIRLVLWGILLITGVLGVSFVAGLLMASSRPLQGVHIARLNDIVVSDKELVFSVLVWAKNPGYKTVPITDVDLDVFATSTHVKKPSVDSKPRTILLGNIHELESPLTFSGGLFREKNEWSVAGVRLLDPGGNSTDGSTDQWQEIIAHPFELTVRGVLRYSLLFDSDVRCAVSGSALVDMPGFI